MISEGYVQNNDSPVSRVSQVKETGYHPIDRWPRPTRQGVIHGGKKVAMHVNKRLTDKITIENDDRWLWKQSLGLGECWTQRFTPTRQQEHGLL